jgi:hypothetical protein
MRWVLAVLLLAVAGILLVFEVSAFLDPVGTKLADDADPFGTAEPWWVHALWFALIALLAGIGVPSGGSADQITTVLPNESLQPPGA